MLEKLTYVKFGTSLFLLLFIFILSGCGGISDDTVVFKSYRDIPGITADEIGAIAQLRERYDYFTLGMLPGIEAFTDINGDMRGFTVHFAQWLTELFDIPFVPAHFSWSGIIDGLEDGSLHFTGEIAPIEMRRALYYTTDAIAHRTLMYFRLAGSEPLSDIAQRRLPRYLLQENTAMSVYMEEFAGERFESVYIREFYQAIELLRSGYADALVAENTLEAYWAMYPDTEMEAIQFLPMIYSPVSLATQTEALKPIIAVVQKALENNAALHFDDLYGKGNREYQRNTLLNQLTPEEMDFINSRPVIRVGARHNDYPIGFFNDRTNQWEGISHDILREISDLTGLQFQITHEPGIITSELIHMLVEADVDMVAKLLRTKDRDEQMRFPSTRLLEDRLVLISKVAMPNQNIADIHSMRIGISSGTAHIGIFNEWFPNHEGIKIYASREASFEALIEGEIDFVFTTQNALLYYTHYRENSQFKINIVFGDIFESTFETNFAFNTEQEILRSVFNKAFALIDTDIIYVQWQYRTYDYRLQRYVSIVPWIVGAGVIIIMVLGFVVLFNVRSRSMRKNLNVLVEKRTEELGMKTALLDSLFNAIPDIIFVKDLSLRLTHVNKAYAKAFNVDEKVIQGKSVEDVSFSDDVKAEITRVDRDVIELGEVIIIEDDAPTVEGNNVLYETIKAPLTQNDKIIGLVGIARDITARRALEKEIQTGYEYSQKLSESLSAITKSPDLYADDVNTAINMILRRAASALLVSRVVLWKLNEDGQGLVNICTYNSKTGETIEVSEYSILNHPVYIEQLNTARLIVVNNTGEDNELNEEYKKEVCAILEAPIRIDGKLFGLIAFEQKHNEQFAQGRNWTNEEKIYVSSLGDVMALVISGDERRKAQEAAHEASRAKSDFLATMSHEIRTPMNSIVGFSELALDAEIPAKTRDFLNKIKDSSVWLLHIINDILDLSKIESGKMEVEKIPFDMQKLFVNCRASMMLKALDKNLTLHFYAEPSMGRMPLGDPTKLRQVLMNLLSNAVKFTNSGIIKLLADIIKVGENTITMRFEVKDSGIGMTKEQINRIFDPFIQAETGTTRKYGGTGLGLSITKKMIEMMGGELEVDSAPGIGSRFGFTLTFDTIDVKNSDRLDDVLIFNDMKKPTFSGEVLVCEDNSLNQQVICEHLTRVGIKSVVAENGKIGVDMVKKRVNRNEKMFDLIFMDIHMPVMDGLEAVEKILELETGVPIVALTANVMVHDRLIYKEKGMNDCLGKPFSTQELWRLLVKYFEPIRWDKDEENQRIKDESDLQRRLIINFVKNNANKFNEISDALKKGDIETAYRLTHTLKGNAGQLNKSLLQRAAKEVESLLKDGENLATPAHMTALEIELAAVMAEFSPLVDSHIKENIEYMDVNAAKELLDKVEPIVTDSDPECLNYLSELQRIQGSEALVRYIDDFDFKAAAKEIAALRGKL